MKIKKLQRNLKRLAKMEAGDALKLSLSILHLQFKIRPRLRVFTKLLAILILTFLLSGKTVNYLKAREAEIKIKGQSILVAKKSEPGSQPSAEIEQVVSVRRSPFEFQKPVDGYLSQGYTFYHRANDIATELGTSIHPLGAGVVEFAGRLADGKGNVVVIDHGDGLKSLYAHMAKISVGMGDLVNTNAGIGTVGLTGHTTGPHVHLEIYDNGVTIDPTGIIPQ